MKSDVALRKILQIFTAIVTGFFILTVASETTGIANEELTSIGSKLIMGGLLTVIWIFIAFCRRHPEWFSDYYY
ncbi:MAG: hypothetical protein EPO37_08530 [Nitrosarchaeum sp.]|nr:MAG: hypothetical protein EPO37_08530 [Nitrosarchaeum sp.]